MKKLGLALALVGTFSFASIPKAPQDQKTFAKNEKTKTDLTAFPDINKIIARGKLIVAMASDDRPPFYFRDKDVNMIGVDSEFARLIAHKISPNLKVDFMRTAKTLNDVIQQVEKGEADIAISKISYTSERSKKIIYSDKPYIIFNITLLLDRKVAYSKTLDSLFGAGLPYKFCAIKGSSQVQFAQELFPGVGMFEADSPDHVVKALVEENKCSARISDSNDIRRILLKDPKLSLRFMSVALKDKLDPIYIVIDPAKPNLARFINALMENDKAFKFTLDDVFKKYEPYLR